MSDHGRKMAVVRNDSDAPLYVKWEPNDIRIDLGGAWVPPLEWIGPLRILVPAGALVDVADASGVLSVRVENPPEKGAKKP